ncbi:hypothetical protein D3C78_1812780 [compost metagenome]
MQIRIAATLNRRINAATIADMLNAINLPRDRYHAHFNLHRYLAAYLRRALRQPGQHRAGAFRLYPVDPFAD